VAGLRDDGLADAAHSRVRLPAAAAHSLTHRQDAEAVAAAKHVLSELHRYMAVQRHGALRVITRWRKRRGSVSSPRHDNRGTDPIDIAVVPPRRVSGRSQRTAYHTPRQPKLSPGQQAIIRSEAGNRTLRELAAAFGVSHETIRTVLKKTSGNVRDAMT
jgi:DNA-directed RNA polymerase sigma subunit (sigma70/sigma32)